MSVFKKIIVGVDFSPVSERAARMAVELAVPLGAEVVLVHVISPAADYADPAGFVTEVRPAIEEQLQKWTDRMRGGHKIKVDWGVVDGRAAEELSKFAERWKGDLIVTGATGRSGLPRALLGSVSERLVRISKVPVMIVGPENE